MELIRNVYSIAYVVAGASFGLLAIAAVAEWKLPYLVTQALTASVGLRTGCRCLGIHGGSKNVGPSHHSWVLATRRVAAPGPDVVRLLRYPARYAAHRTQIGPKTGPVPCTDSGEAVCVAAAMYLHLLA